MKKLWYRIYNTIKKFIRSFNDPMGGINFDNDVQPEIEKAITKGRTGTSKSADAKTGKKARQR